jgi:aminopeptidase N
MLTPAPRTVYLRDYAPPPFLVGEIELDVDLQENFALVRAQIDLRRNPQAADRSAPLALDGDELALEWVALDGRRLTPDEYAVDSEHLTLPRVPDAFRLQTCVRIHPRENTKLMGLYGSKDGFFTQCEAEGFRRITFFPTGPT